MTRSPTNPRPSGTARPRGRPRQEDAAHIQTRLLSAALDEFLARGYGAASLTQIIKAAGASKTTFYARFASKEALFQAVMRDQVQRMGPAEALQDPRATPNLEQGLKAYANHMLDINLHGEMLEINRLISNEAHRFPELGAAAAERAELGIQRITDFIQRCAVVERIPCRRPRDVAEAFIYMLRGWHLNAMLASRTTGARERRQWVDRAVDTLLLGRRHW